MSRSCQVIVKTPLESMEFHGGSRRLPEALGIEVNYDRVYGNVPAVDFIDAHFHIIAKSIGNMRAVMLSTIAQECRDNMDVDPEMATCSVDTREWLRVEIKYND